MAFSSFLRPISLQKPFRKFLPPGPGEVWHSPTECSAQGPQGSASYPGLTDSAHVYPLLPFVPTIAPVLPCSCPFVRDWTCWAVAVCLMLCVPARPCPDQGQACGSLIPVFQRGLVWCLMQPSKGALHGMGHNPEVALNISPALSSKMT